MERHFLITIGDDPGALYGIRFAQSFFHNKDDIEFTLLSIAPKPVTDALTEGALEVELMLELNSSERAHANKNALASARDILVQSGFNPKNIRTKLIHAQFGTVRDIVQEAHAGLYDAVILGKRGFSFMEGLLNNSVSTGVISEEIDFPVWICKRPRFGQKNVLVCADGSPCSLRAADHVGFVMRNEPEHEVTILHIARNGSDADEIVSCTLKAITDNDIDPARVRVKILCETKVFTAIMQELADGDYAALALGRTGRGKGLMASLFFGSTSTRIINSLREGVVWISR